MSCRGQHRLKLLIGAAITAALALPTQADTLPLIAPNVSFVNPSPAQQIRFYVTGNNAIVGEDINVQINDGTFGPTITGIDILTGTMFSGNNFGNNGGIFSSSDPLYSPYNQRLANVSTSTLSGTVSDMGLLVTLTIDASLMPLNSTFQVNLVNTVNGPSDFLPLGSPIYLSTANVPHNLFSVGTSAVRQWYSPVGSTWGQDGNWMPFVAPYTTGDAANFLGFIGSDATVTLDANRIAGSILFNNTAHTYTLAQGAGGTLTLDNGMNTPSITNSGGSHTLAARVLLTAGTAIAANAGVLHISGSILGAADNISLTGGGLLILSGSNAYAGTNIALGSVLQVGNGGTTGTLGTAVVANGGLLRFNRTDVCTVPNPITGNGSLVQSGTGTTVLTGAANYGGPTTLTAGGLTFGGGVSHSITGVTGTGALAVAASTILLSDGILMPAGSLTIAGTETIRSSGSNGAYQQFALGHSSSALSGTSMVTGANLSVTGTLDIKNNALIVEAASSTSKSTLLTSLAGQLGSAITSSTSASSPNYTLDVIDNAALGATMFGGLPVDPNSIIVTEALKGDANMDGSVGATDLAIWKANFGLSNIYSAASGDYNHDGSVGATDLAYWKANFGLSVASNPAPSDFSTGGLTSMSALSGGSPVPEPATLAALGIGALLLGRRRRRQCNKQRLG